MRIWSRSDWLTQYVFCTGKFEDLHKGHEAFLRWVAAAARAPYDKFGVAVVPDAVISENHPEREVLEDQYARAHAVSQLPFVSAVVIDSMDRGLKDLGAFCPRDFVYSFEQRANAGRYTKILDRRVGRKVHYSMLPPVPEWLHGSKLRERSTPTAPNRGRMLSMPSPENVAPSAYTLSSGGLYVPSDV